MDGTGFQRLKMTVTALKSYSKKQNLHLKINVSYYKKYLVPPNAFIVNVQKYRSHWCLKNMLLTSCSFLISIWNCNI